MHGTIKSSFWVEWRPFSALASIVAQWQALAERALERNVFYEPAFAFAAAPVFGPQAGAGLVWSRTKSARLVGLFPSVIERRRYGLALPILLGWTHPYAPYGAPLVDEEAADAVFEAWLAQIESDARTPKLVLLPYLPTEGRLASALDSALSRSGGRSIFFNCHARAQLAPTSDRSSYLERALPRKKLKELNRQMRRLGDAGTVSWRMASDPGSLAPALSNFLRIEASGWKGRAGTAARHDSEIRHFMETAVLDLAADGKVRIAGLLLDGRVVASLILLRSGDAAWAWKIAYDETLARISPGVQLMIHVTKDFLDDATTARVDSCAGPGHPMVDHIWRERLPLADRLIRVGSGGALEFAEAAALEAMRRAALATARKARDLVRS